MIDTIEFKEILRAMLRTEIEEDDEMLKVEFESKQFTLTKEYFYALIDKLNSRNTEDETLIYNDHYYEILTRGENLFLPRSMLSETVSTEMTKPKSIVTSFEL